MDVDKPTDLLTDELKNIDAYWRAANYLSVGQIYLMDNPLLKQPLRPLHIKPRLLGHWGTSPGLNLCYVHLNRLIRNNDLNMIFITGPGHGGPAILANTWLEGTYSELFPEVPFNETGMRELFRRFSFPGGVPSHVAAETPGSIHEGGELGYSLAHAYGAAFDNPDLIVACIIGDGEAETGPLAASWHSNKFINPKRDGAVLPILHLNGYKIANPTLLARINRDELDCYLRGMGYKPYYVVGNNPTSVHQEFASVADQVLSEIQNIWQNERLSTSKHNKDNSFTDKAYPMWPMIVLITPKGWTGPKEIDGLPIEGTWRAHQVPITSPRTNPDHLSRLETWLQSYRPEELFDDSGVLLARLQKLHPQDNRRMSANPHANGGLLLKTLQVGDFRKYQVKVAHPGSVQAESTKVLGTWLRDVIKNNPTTFRLFGPDETESNRLSAVYEETGKAWMPKIINGDNHLSRDGRVMEILSEHTCQGWLEGYLLTGRHGLFSCYEAFVHIVDSMFNQHAKWLKVSKDIEWRKPIASLNYLLTSHVWRQDHNGFSHQDPGFIDHVINKKAEIIRVYFPSDANTLLSVANHCLSSRNYINVIVAGKQPEPVWLSMDEAVLHCTRGVGIWDWAGNDDGGDPDVVMVCIGDVPTLETLAGVDILRQNLPELKIRVVNVVDLMRLEPPGEHPHGLDDVEFDAIFTTDKPVIVAYHGYPWLIHRLTYRRHNHDNIHVRGYKEEGTTTTPFDMVMMNDLDRFHLVMDVIDRIGQPNSKAVKLRGEMVDKRIYYKDWTRLNGDDHADITNWRWPY